MAVLKKKCACTKPKSSVKGPGLFRNLFSLGVIVASVIVYSTYNLTPIIDEALKTIAPKFQDFKFPAFGNKEGQSKPKESPGKKGGEKEKVMKEKEKEKGKEPQKGIKKC